MAQTSEFLPQWTSPPGRTIEDLMSARQLSRADLAHLLAKSPPDIEALLDGREPITLGIARQLQDVLGGSVAFWMTRDRQYRDDVARLREIGLALLHELPLGDMSRLGWIPSDPPEGFEVEAVLRFFAVPSVGVWQSRYAEAVKQAAFRTSPTFQSKLGAVAAWLRQGERLADSITCEPWDRDAFRKVLVELRALTRVRDPQRFAPKLQREAAGCGVAVVLLEAPSGCRASGAARWLSADKAMILLSARHLSADHLWFTFYHESAHLLLHREMQLFIDEAETVATAMEEEANQYAAELLIPPSFNNTIDTVRLDTLALVRLATAIGVAPGIVVAQMQRRGRIPQDRFNRLKRRYKWVDGKLVSR